VLLMFGQQRPQALFDACIQARVKLSSYTVHIQTDSSVPGKKEQAHFDFAVKGSTALFRMQEPATPILDRSDRSFLFRRDKLLGYDAIANESLERPNKANSSYTARLSEVLGKLPDALTLAVDVGVMKRFFDKFRGFRDWTVTRKGSSVTLYRAVKGTETLFRFGASQPFLQEVLIKIPNSKLHWVYSFSSDAAVTLAIPADASHVYTFNERAAPPKFASIEAQTSVQKMLRAYSSLRNGVVEVSSADGSDTLTLGGKKLREDTTAFQWSFDGSVLSIFNKRTNKFYRGKAKRVVLSEYVVAVGAEVNPLIRYILAHRVPFSDLFPTAATVKFVGSGVTNGVSDDILEVAEVNPRSSIFVRHDNYLLQSIESETVDKSGRVLTRSTRSFKYSELGEAPDSSRFALSPGGAVILPLPKLKDID